MAVTPASIAVALGRPTPADPQVGQWAYWIDAAYREIRRRADRAGVVYESLDPVDVNYVVTETVVAQVKRPDDSTSVEVSVDDARTVRRYSSSTGRIVVPDDLWATLGLEDADDGQSFTITPFGGPDPSPARRWAW